MTKQTPGPWAVGPNWSITDQTGFPLAKVYGTRADLELMAASPELADSAAAFLNWFRVFLGDTEYNRIRSDELDTLRAALGKAGWV